MWWATLWKTKEMPVNNTIPGDRSLDDGTIRAPFLDEILLRTLEFWPEFDVESSARCPPR